MINSSFPGESDCFGKDRYHPVLEDVWAGVKEEQQDGGHVEAECMDKQGL